MASQVPEQSGGRHQRQNASQLTRAILARQGEAFTAVFLLQRPKPAGVLIDDGVGMSADERLPSPVRAQVDRDHAQSVSRCRSLDHPALVGLDQAGSRGNWDMSTIRNRFCNGIS